MVRRHKWLNFNLIKKINWISDVDNKKIEKSFSKNFNILPKNRLSFIIQKTYKNKQQRFYMSQNKLQCHYSYSLSVPSQKLFSSRFFLNKAVDRLAFAGYQKW